MAKASSQGPKHQISHGDLSIFFNKDIARTTSFGYSTRSFYNRKPEGVPFEWEKKPGTPKNPHIEDVIPPLSPPPAILSMGLPKPRIVGQELRESSKLRFKFWKKIRIHRRSADRNEERVSTNAQGVQNKGITKNSESWSFDGDANVYMSPRNSSFSSASSSSMSLSNGRRAMESKSDMKDSAGSSIHQPKSCGPWNFRALTVHLARRI